MMDLKKTFTPRLVVLFQGARKLRNNLLTAKLCPLQRSVGSCKGKDKRYQVCMNVAKSNTFSSSVKKKEFVITMFPSNKRSTCGYHQ